MMRFKWLLTGLLISAQSVATGLENQWAMRFVYIPPGEFVMGLDDYDEAYMEIPDPEADALRDEQPAHTVRLSRGFYIGQTEVTQQQWLAIMDNRPGPESVWKREDWQKLPVASVSWLMAQRFVEEINKMDKQFRYRLPTEAEWEYVARAGSKELRPVEIENLGDVAWFIENSKDQVQPVASRRANAYGVYDMLGNTWEWVADWYAPDTYQSKKRTDPVGPENGFFRVRRGGSYHCPVHMVRPGYRAANAAQVRYEVNGFRVIAERRE